MGDSGRSRDVSIPTTPPTSPSTCWRGRRRSATPTQWSYPAAVADYGPQQRGRLSPLVRAARAQLPATARLASICTGSFVLAAAGLLAGRRATTHWKSCPELSALYPEIDVGPDVLYTDDRRVLTSARPTPPTPTATRTATAWREPSAGLSPADGGRARRWQGDRERLHRPRTGDRRLGDRLCL
ncbi:DJ-1/PfpI family protein [Streptomyces sp. SudanB91_2054]|uniref:DJ-1/PfpI family protein n=1 Tax=Streptomyces sp. SudanB91_2054 TaxID=3035278 RepID=UPI0036DC7348